MALDSNFQGTYISFVEEVGNKKVGRITFSTNPFSNSPDFSVSQIVTPGGVIPHDTFIQASRKGWGDKQDKNSKTVVYGWQDLISKSIYIGVSSDGEKFPLAKKVVDDPLAVSGPAVAIRGNYVIATYQTRDKKFYPINVKVSDGKSFPVWVESFNGGQSWSAPKSLFGINANDFPLVKYKDKDGGISTVMLAGGTSQPNSPILSWSASSRPGEEGNGGSVDKSIPFSGMNTLPSQINANDGGTTFVQSSLSGIGIDDNDAEISVVSFRAIEPNAKWTHVIANNILQSEPMSKSKDISKLGVNATQFQYSALIDTPVRATIYKEINKDENTFRLVAAISTDTGKNFDKHISFDDKELSALGVYNLDSAFYFASSQCLFEDRDGEVYVDLLIITKGKASYVKLPIGVNTNFMA